MSSIGKVAWTSSVYFTWKEEKRESADGNGRVFCEDIVTIEDSETLWKLIQDRVDG